MAARSWLIMVVMNRADEGHPVGAMLLLCSMFAFAWVFHAVTKPDATLPVAPAVPVVPVVLWIPAVLGVPEVPAVRVDSKVPVVPDVPGVPAVRVTTGTTGTIETTGPPGTSRTSGTAGTPGTPGTTGTIVYTVSWSITPPPFAASVSAVEPRGQSGEGGVVTRAFATTGAA